MNPQAKNFEKIQSFSSETMTKFSEQIAGINSMLEIVNKETQKYNEMHTYSKEKIILATEINNANIYILNKKFDLIISHIQDIYSRLDLLLDSMQPKTE